MSEKKTKYILKLTFCGSEKEIEFEMSEEFYQLWLQNPEDVKAYYESALMATAVTVLEKELFEKKE